MGRNVVSGMNQRVAFKVQRSEHLGLRTLNPPPSRPPSLSCSGIPHVQAIYLSSLDLLLLWWPFFDIENILLEAVARR